MIKLFQTKYAILRQDEENCILYLLLISIITYILIYEVYYTFILYILKDLFVNIVKFKYQ